MKPKVALVKDGFLPPGSENKKGRLSGAAIDRLKELAGQGWDIDGYAVSKNADSNTVSVEKKAVDPNAVIDIPNIARDEREMRAFTTEGEVGMRTVDNICGASLTYCHCPHPRVWVDFDREAVVYFKPIGKG
jgi:hypothetical protein